MGRMWLPLGGMPPQFLPQAAGVARPASPGQLGSKSPLLLRRRTLPQYQPAAAKEHTLEIGEDAVAVINRMRSCVQELDQIYSTSAATAGAATCPSMRYDVDDELLQPSFVWPLLGKLNAKQSAARYGVATRRMWQSVCCMPPPMHAEVATPAGFDFSAYVAGNLVPAKDQPGAHKSQWYGHFVVEAGRGVSYSYVTDENCQCGCLIGDELLSLEWQIDLKDRSDVDAGAAPHLAASFFMLHATFSCIMEFWSRQAVRRWICQICVDILQPA
ncbi:hypothetical protein ACLKA7_005276 [Drosophila subpalustris]